LDSQGSPFENTLLSSLYRFLARYYPDISVAPDRGLGIIFGIGGFLGMYIGARIQKFVPAKYNKGILCVCVMFVAGNFIFRFFM